MRGQHSAIIIKLSAMFDYKKFFLDLFFPIQCLGCNKEGAWLCQDCLAKIKINLKDRPHRPSQAPALSGVWVAADYKQSLVANALHSFKYNFISNLGQDLSDLLISFLASKISQKKVSGFDLVIAVPLARKRRLWRGFNQAEILAQRVSEKFGWPLGSNLISRKYHTHPQVGLKAAARLSNVRGIFVVNNCQLLKNKKVLLVDDVMTTGATMQECARALKESGAREVWGLVVAKG